MGKHNEIKRMNDYRNLLQDITSLKFRKEDSDLRKECKEIYSESLKSREDIVKEKQRVTNNLETIKSPFFSMGINLGTTFMSAILGFTFSKVSENNDAFLILLTTVILIIIYIIYYKTIDEIKKDERKTILYRICLDVLNELENEMKFNSNEVLKEVAITINDKEEIKSNRAYRIKQKLK
ncbi:MAG: hypothetical protein E6929_11635 [Clostridium sp.]|nr:hypothetical protein [Clostridium sp.]